MVVILPKKVIIINHSMMSVVAQSSVVPISSNKQVKLMPKVQSFLESVSRNSRHSANVYGTGVVYFARFLTQQGLNQTPETILETLGKNETNIYELFDGFVAFLVSTGLSIPTIRLNVAAIRSYFAYHDIDVIPSKFKRKVRMPKLYREDEQPLDAEDIRKIILSYNNRRMKAYLLVLASGAMRAMEALAIRVKDCDFYVKPTIVHIRKEYSKTRVARNIYISDEATQYLKQWIDWKYRDKGDERTRNKDPNDLVFGVYNILNEPDPHNLYPRVLGEFERLLTVVGLDERKEDGRRSRRKVTLHSLRRHAKGVLSNQTNSDYSEWYLGHSKSPYFTIKESERRTLYTERVMKYLTFLDYSLLESTGRSVEAKLSEKEREIQLLRKHQEMRDDALTSLSDQVSKLMQEIEVLKERGNES
jgi:integrase